jgi:ABC-type lipoprotein export system ATPase subunit/phage shock protein A
VRGTGVVRKPIANEYPRGSEWRRWDPHVHTPHSTLNNQFGSDFDSYAQQLLFSAVSLGIVAIGVTDYFTISGYRELTARVADDAWMRGRFRGEEIEAVRRILLIPNVELRSTVIVSSADGDSRVNFHVLFSPALSPDEIEEHFFRELKFTAEGGPGQLDERQSVTEVNLSLLGGRLKGEHAGFTQPDLYVGMMNAVVSHEDVTNILEQRRTLFEDKYLMVVATDEDLAALGWDSQAHLTRKLMVQKSHMLFSANPSTRMFGLGLKHATPEAFIGEFKTLKPCIHGSDAHAFNELFEPPERRYMWVRADPTWLGLRQLLYEPDQRVTISPNCAPLQAIKRRTSQTIEAIEVRRVASAPGSEEWFDVQLPLNPGLCAVIGNKGSGKSALADIIGLLGATRHHDSFSFLRNDRFRNPRYGGAKHYEATLLWADGSRTDWTSLDSMPSSSAVERVKYIGQGYLERITNELGAEGGGRFYRELQEVIFSHVSHADRQGHETLADLLDATSQGIQGRLDAFLVDLHQINEQFGKLLARREPEHRRAIEENLTELNRQLTALYESKPEAPVPPDADPAAAQIAADLRSQVDQAREAINALATDMSNLTDEDLGLAKRHTVAKRLLDRVRTASAAVSKSVSDAEEDFATLGINATDVIDLKVDETPIQSVIDSVEDRRGAIRREMDPASEGSLKQRLDAATSEFERLQERLSTPERQYQEAVTSLQEWDEQRRTIVGDPGTPNTVAYFESLLKDLENVPTELTDLKRRRRRVMLELFAEKEELRENYARYHSPVSDFLTSSPVANAEGFRLAFAASMQETAFEDRLLAFLDHRRQGPFFGQAEARNRVASLTALVDWTSARSVIRFAETIFDLLTGPEQSWAQLGNQLLQATKPIEVMDYVFGLDYVGPFYQLTWDGKSLEELSPGERGNLLLIFYLLVDRQTIPIVIDQPEENLDNQTVVRTLVPCMRDARQRRQVVMVTHNPNLAVVCDADQIISAELDATAGPRITYESGSIEHPDINRRVVDVLEGTMPAFSSRASKYIGGRAAISQEDSAA